jgi:hypothetical protein
MSEAGIDISQKKTQAVFDVWQSGQIFGNVVTVCGEAESGARPVQFFRSRRLDSLGHLTIRRALKAAMEQNWRKRVMCVTPSRQRSKNGVSLCAKSALKR